MGGITEAGRKVLSEEMAEREKAWEGGQKVEEVVGFVEEFVQRGQKAQEGVDEIMADANRNVDLERLEKARIELRDLDVVRDDGTDEDVIRIGEDLEALEHRALELRLAEVMKGD